MSGPERMRLENRRQGRTIKMVWSAPDGLKLGFHLMNGYDFPSTRRVVAPGVAMPRKLGLGRPLEVWLNPSRRTSKTGGALVFFAQDEAESLSLHLQHGHSFPDLRERFKPGSLALCAIEHAWMLSAHETAEVPALPEDLSARWAKIVAADAAEAEAQRSRRQLYLTNITKAVLAEMGARPGGAA